MSLPQPDCGVELNPDGIPSSSIGAALTGTVTQKVWRSKVGQCTPIRQKHWVYVSISEDDILVELLTFWYAISAHV